MASPVKKFTKGIGIASVAQLVTILEGLILLPILTKNLGSELYGIWTQIIVTISLIMPISLLQLEYAMTRFLTPEKDKRIISKGISSIFFTVGSTALFSSFFLSFVATFFTNMTSDYIIQISAILLFFTAIDRIILQYFISFRFIEAYACFTIIQAVLEIALISLFVLSDYGILGGLISLLIVRIIIFIASMLIIIRKVKLTLPDISLIKKYLTFSAPLIPFSISWWLVNSSDRYIIGYFLGPSEVGTYSASYTIGNMIGFLYVPITLILLPTIVNLYENGDLEGVKLHLRYTIKFFLMLAIPSFIGLSVLSKPLLEILTTLEFTGSYLIIPIVALGTVFFRLGNLFSDILLCFKCNKIVSITYVFSGIANFIITAILVPKVGIIGAAVATLLTFVLIFLILGFISFNKLSFDADLKFIGKSIISSLIMGLIIFQFNPSNTEDVLKIIIISILIYFFSFVCLGGVTREELKILKTNLQ